MLSPDHNHHLRRTIVASLAGLACVAAAASPAAATPTASRAQLQHALDAVVAAGAPGAALLVRDGATTIRLASGHGNLAPKSPMRVAHRSRIGGLTKSFVATVVLQLAGEGRLSLDDTVGRWLPGALSNGDAVSIRQLLNHTSGVYNYAEDPSVLAPYMAGDLTRRFDISRGVRIAAKKGPLFAPGAKLSYSNTNYVLLGMIVEAVTHNTIGAELRARIIEPLGLRHTTYPSSWRIPGSVTHGYLGGNDVTPLSPTLLGASGALVSNGADVADFYRALLSGRLLAPAQLAAMQTIDPVATGGIPDAGLLGGGWGLGLLREQFACAAAWGHDSENPGYTTAAWNSADGARQVVVVVNTALAHDERPARALRGVLKRAYCG